MKLFIITGTCGAGKSTMKDRLAELLETGNLLNPFREGTVEKSTAHVIEEIRQRYMKD